MTNKFLKKSLPAGRQGFTLLETLIAVLILVSAVAGPLTIAFKGFNAATTAKEQIVAFYLAQDAVEYIRFARDTNLLAGRSWLGDASVPMANLNTCTGANGCYFDSTLQNPNQTTGIVACSGTCPVMRFDSSTYTYQYDGTDTSTPYTRTVKIISVNANEVLASTTVTWTRPGGIVRSVTLFETLFNWP